jgi:hypothetical protein
MNRSLQSAFVASALALLSASAFGKTGHEIRPEPALSIHLYNQAQAPTGVLHSATAEAARLFRPAGIRITWEEPSVEAPEDQGIDMSDTRSAASAKSPNQRPYLVVRLMRGMPARVFPHTLGFALPFARTGAQVTIFYDRVETLTRDTGTASHVILGHALAHEIGHVLLGSLEHSPSGLMQACWKPASLRLASVGLLAFYPEQAERMSAGLERFQARHPLPEHEPALAWSAPRRSPE